MNNRWWIYQRERFPLLAHAPLIAAFSLSALCCSSLLRGDSRPPSPLAMVTAFVTSLLFFLQLRIADEFKDFEEDARYRAYRPVPRGLISLRELGVVGLLAAAAQLGLAWLLRRELMGLLLAVWAFLGLMSKEFFVGEWLKSRPVVIIFTHMVIIVLVDLYATACDWLPAGARPPDGLGWFLAVSYFNGIVLEIGRKIRAPAAEEVGVRTYTVLWGRRNAVLAWLGALAMTAAAALLAAWKIDFLTVVAAIVGSLLAMALLIGRQFIRSPSFHGGKAIEAISGVWTLLMYLNLGLVPLLWRWYSAAGTSP